jgi:hypothetical protein
MISSRHRPIALGAMLSALLAGPLACAMLPHPLEGEVRFQPGPPPQQADPWRNWPLRPERFVEVMTNGDGELKRAKRTAAGTSGAKKIVARMNGTDADLTFKWKDVPPDLDGINNAPRKEAAAYEVQKLFVDEEYFVVPPSVFLCTTWPELERRFLDARCNLGLVSEWLDDLTLDVPIYKPERFSTDRDYAYYMGVLDILTYLIDHKDGRAGNFLFDAGGSGRIYSIDNGVAFQRWPFYNWFVPNWDSIRLPALPRSAVDRLRGVTREQVEALGVVAQLELDDDGLYRSVPPGPNLAPGRGARRRDGVLQFGLTEDEIATVWTRIQTVVRRVDAGEIPTF